MAIRLERSGGLVFIHGSPDPPVQKKWWQKVPGGLGPWLGLVALAAVAIGAPHIVSGWPVLVHAVKGFLTAVQ
jgi:hypothetical protein